MVQLGFGNLSFRLSHRGDELRLLAVESRRFPFQLREARELNQISFVQRSRPC
jgi:hypothetical protein